MALAITSLDGLTVYTDRPPSPANVQAQSDDGVAFALSCIAVETEASLSSRALTVTVDWRDGTAVETFSGYGSVTVSSTRTLKPGVNVVQVTAANRRSPVPDAVVVAFPVTVTVASTDVSTRFLFGPILPKDSGFPNAQQWFFAAGSNTEVLASAVKMLLLTSKGERIMLPDYGTGLRSLLFNMRGPGLEALVSHEITTALSAWEPRVELVAINITWADEKSANVDMVLQSKLDNRQFTSQLSYTL